VAGGLARFVAHLQQDLQPERLAPDLARLLNYEKLNPDDRAAAIAAALESLGAAPAPVP